MLNYYQRSHSVALTEDQIHHIAPSVFAEDKHKSRSDKFATIPTISIVRALNKEGFEVVSAQQCNVRDVTRADFTRHLLRLRHRDDIENGNKNKLKDTHGEIVLKNANDGSSSYELMAGAYRLVCSNGMVGWSPFFDGIKVRHSGDFKKVADSVIEGTYTVVDETNNLLAARDRWSQITLIEESRLALAEASHIVRFGDSEGKTDTPIKPAQLLNIRRSGDSGKDLWTTFNVIQENAIRGGLTGYNRTTNRRTTTREVKSLDNDVKINRALWRIADHFAQQVKSAA